MTRLERFLMSGMIRELESLGFYRGKVVGYNKETGESPVVPWMLSIRIDDRLKRKDSPHFDLEWYRFMYDRRINYEWFSIGNTLLGRILQPVLLYRFLRRIRRKVRDNG